ncbi:hypothetical protein NDI37_14550 [Funiculus sociatus GB2-A5]|uniref:Uncharacterized protein n=1 Tax=Funiculus sociatus GB2-A5 TaxID=2933946 RepID=A0ABV0JSN6_9CYAN|nr:MULTISPECIES: hypothetical protein [unclassified Trichocoleus]MBD1905393.1 hypothetical protein [Trichocoleus sp. FACHB-832]MBD2061887.1 hypothetical protein [Trichocoleus sp. FACHB-6]
MKNSDEDAISAIASVMLWWRMRDLLTYIVVENARSLNLYCGGECDPSVMLWWRM